MLHPIVHTCRQELLVCAVDGVELEMVELYTSNRRRGTFEQDTFSFYRSLLYHTVAGFSVVGYSAHVRHVADFIT